MNLLVFLGYVIQYKLSYASDSGRKAGIQNIKNMLDESGAVWQKFAQMLSYNEDIIGQEIALELQNMLCECPTHNHEYSRKVVKRDFGDKYDYDNMKPVGSGTIAQVYKVGHCAIKIKHPNVDEEVRSAVETYNGVKDSFFFPSSLKPLCDIFFKGLKSQLSMWKEYKNGLLMKELIHKDTDPKNNLFIIPEMIDYSEECVVMTYEESTPILLKTREAIDKHVLMKACLGINRFGSICLLHGFMHSDMHYGNFGIRGNDAEKIQLVIYDFGFMCDIREDMNLKRRVKFMNSMAEYDIPTMIDCIFEGCEKYIIRDITNKMTDIHSRDKINCRDNLKKIPTYILYNGIKVNDYILQVFTNQEKYIPISKLIVELEKDSELQEQRDYSINHGGVKSLIKYYPYDDCKILSLLS